MSPWADRSKMAEYLGSDYVYSMKPSPTPLAAHTMDEDAVRTALREDLRKAKGCQVEIMMKDNHTIGGNPENVITWTRIAKEEAMRL